MGGTAVLETAGGGKHSYSLEERSTFAKMINLIMRKDEDVADRIPMNAEDENLFHVFDNGILLCKLVMSIDPECIDTRTINRMDPMNIY